MDLGIALGSAAKTASIFNADNRIMYRAGVAARRIGMMDADVVVGIPISATGKSIYFDRK
ncbi:MAG: ferredoxin domain-containing protein [Chloroflexi bacterium]|nr:ferredoxin domain-containing protein [Chloroflexota bacterium]